MLKKLKCIEATATLASSAVQAASTSGSSANNTIGANIKIIKTEPVDFEMMSLDSKALSRESRHHCADSAEDAMRAATESSPPPSHTTRYQHVQIQTVPPRQPGAGLIATSAANATQKIILTPRVEFVQRPTSTSGGSSGMGTIIKHVYTQPSRPPSASDHMSTSTATAAASASASASASVSASSSSSSANVGRRVSRSPQADCTGSPQIIITRSLPTNNTTTHVTHLQRRHSASPSHYQRIAAIVNSSNGCNSNSAPPSPPPPTLHHHLSSHRSPQPSPPPLSLQQQHVRVIRDGRLYEESLAASVLARRHSVSPPPLLHHHHSRSAPVSPVVARRYSISPHDAAPLSSPAGALTEQQGHQQHIVTHSKQQQQQLLHSTSFAGQYQRQQVHSPPLPPPPPPTSASASTVIGGKSAAQQHQNQQFVISPTRKYIVAGGARHTNVMSSTSAVHQHQQQQQQQHQQQQQQHYVTHKHQHQQQQQQQQQPHSHYQLQLQHQNSHQQTAVGSASPSSTAATSHATHNFRTPVVTSSSSSSSITSGNNDSQHHYNHNNNNINTAMRPPPPPPPPKIKNSTAAAATSSIGGSGSGSVNGNVTGCKDSGNSSSNLTSGSMEEPSSSIPDLEFDGTTVLCRVCGDKASGFHYGVHSCEGCKGFFRRSIQQKIQYRPCTKNQQCSILRINRNRCQYCRLKKCIAVGMSRDAVRFGRVPKREKARILAAMQQSTQNRGQQRALAGELDDQPRLIAAVLRAHLETCEFTKDKVAAMRQRARECPSYSMPTLLACPLNPAPELQSEQEFSQRFAHVIRGVIDFAGMIPGFQLLTQDDKFTLLKAGLFDALFVRLICMFDSSINSIICLNGQVMRRDAIQNGANARFLVDSTFNFAERMNSMNLSDAEIGLFCAIVLITPDRPGLRNIELIEKMYSRLKGCLQKVINQNRPDQPEFMAKLLDTMPDLRTLSTLHTEKLVVFRTEHKELLRQQMWTMDEEQPTNVKSPAINWDDPRMDVEAKSPLGSVSSTESGDLEYTTSSTTSVSHQHNHHQPHQPSALASSAPLLAATLSGTCPLRNRANSGSSGDSTADIDIVGSHAHLTQNGLTITPIVRSHSHQQLHHHLTTGAPNRYRKLDSPTDSGIESGNEKNDCNSKAVSSGGSSSCSSPRSSVDDALDCTDATAASTSQVTISVSPVRSPQPAAPTSTSSPAATANTSNALKRQIVEDMPVLKRVLQAPPLYDTNSLMDEAYKPHKKFRALRHREIESAEADASSTSNSSTKAATTSVPTSSPAQSSQTAANSPPPPNQSVSTPPATVVVSQCIAPPTTSPHTSPAIAASNQHQHQHQHQLQHQHHHQLQQQQSQLHMHLTRHILNNSGNSSCNNNSNSNNNSANNNNGNGNNQLHQQQTSSLSSTHSVLAKSLMAEPRMTPEQMKRSDIIQNYIMRDPASASPAASCSLAAGTPTSPGSRSPAPLQHLSNLNHTPHHYGSNGSPSSSNPVACNNSNCASPSTTTVTLASPPPPPSAGTPSTRWHGHSVITTTSINQRQQSVSPSSNGSSSSSSSSSSNGCQYFQSPHSTSASVSPPRPSPSTMNSPPRLLELQVDIADSQQPLNLSKKSPTPPPSKLQALVAAATAAQRYPTVSADVTVTPTIAPSSQPPTTVSAPANSTQQLQVHKVMLEA